VSAGHAVRSPPLGGVAGPRHGRGQNITRRRLHCQRALTVVKNVGIDVKACKCGLGDEAVNIAHQIADEAVNIAHQIAAKVPTT
jgi:hypothetical protein